MPFFIVIWLLGKLKHSLDFFYIKKAFPPFHTGFDKTKRHFWLRGVRGNPLKRKPLRGPAEKRKAKKDNKTNHSHQGSD